MLKQIIVAAVLFALCAVLLLSLVNELDPATQTWHQYRLQQNIAEANRLAPFWTVLKQIALSALAAVLAGLGIGGMCAAVGVGLALCWRALLQVKIVYPKDALYPATIDNLRISKPVNEDGAQRIRAAMKDVDRLNAGTMRQLLNPSRDEVVLPEPAISVSVSPEQVLEFDPVQHPHWMLIGETGSGKSHAAYAILDRIAQRYPSEFLICERDGINWNQQAAATTLDGYAAALQTVEQERQRRAALLREADVDHVSRLSRPLPYLVLVLEEAESIYGRLFAMDRRAAQTFVATLRDLASLGRKEGLILVIATQTGTSQVFDVPTRKNFGNKLLFRSESSVGDQWGIPRSAGLATLPTGTAYSLRHSAPVTFPLTARPQLPRAGLPLERLQLAADAEADGLGADDSPDRVAVQEAVYRTDAPQMSVLSGNRTGTPVSVPRDVPPGDDEIKRLIWQTWRRTRSLKATERELYDQDGGIKFYWVRDAVAEMEARRGRRLQEGHL